MMVFNDEKEWRDALSWDDHVEGVSLLCSSYATTVWGLPWGRSLRACGAGADVPSRCVLMSSAGVCLCKFLEVRMSVQIRA